MPQARFVPSVRSCSRQRPTRSRWSWVLLGGKPAIYAGCSTAIWCPQLRRLTCRTASQQSGPFDVNGNVKQAYLVKVNDAELFPLLEFLYSRDSAIV